jgi:hypothetical protein
MPYESLAPEMTNLKTGFETSIKPLRETIEGDKKELTSQKICVSIASLVSQLKKEKESQADLISKKGKRKCKARLF